MILFFLFCFGADLVLEVSVIFSPSLPFLWLSHTVRGRHDMVDVMVVFCFVLGADLVTRCEGDVLPTPPFFCDLSHIQVLHHDRHYLSSYYSVVLKLSWLGGR